MKKRSILLLIIGYVVAFGCSVFTYETKLAHPISEDMGHLLPVSIKSIETATGEKELQVIVKKANEHDDKLSIAGMQHSQGGQTLYPNAIMIDMKKYNKILNLDQKH